MIDMNKQYKYRNAPEGQEFRRILCVDRISDCFGGEKQYPVLTEDMTGIMHPHTKCGGCNASADTAFDLIEVSKYDHIKKGDLVMVWHADYGNAQLRRFEKEDQKRAVCKKIYSDDYFYWSNCETVADYTEKYLK